MGNVCVSDNLFRTVKVFWSIEKCSSPLSSLVVWQSLSSASITSLREFQP